MNLKKIYGGVLVSLICGSLLSLYFSHVFWLFDLFSHFHLQLLIALFLLLILGVFSRSIELIAINIFYILFLTGMFIFPAKFTSDTPKDPILYFHNAYYRNTESSKISELIKTENPEMVAIVEAPQDLVELLSEDYGEAVVDKGAGAFRCAIFVRGKAAKIESELKDTCVVQTENFVLIATHPTPPLIPSAYEAQRNHFAELRSYLDSLEQKDQKFILVGDFNSTRYSQVFRRNFGKYFEKNYYSWESGSLLTIPIDHALSNMKIRVGLAERLGSDHKGLWVRLPKAQVDKEKR